MLSQGVKTMIEHSFNQTLLHVCVLKVGGLAARREIWFMCWIRDLNKYGRFWFESWKTTCEIMGCQSDGCLLPQISKL